MAWAISIPKNVCFVLLGIGAVVSTLLFGSSAVATERQFVCESDWNRLVIEYQEALNSGNALIVEDKTQKVRQHLTYCYGASTELSGWIGVLTGVDYAPEGMHPSADRQGIRVLVGGIDLSDPYYPGRNEIVFTNYNDQTQQLIELGQVLRALRAGDVVRVWGSIDKISQRQNLLSAMFKEVTGEDIGWFAEDALSIQVRLERIHKVDLEVERAETQARLDMIRSSLLALDAMKIELLGGASQGASTIEMIQHAGSAGIIGRMQLVSSLLDIPEKAANSITFLSAARDIGLGVPDDYDFRDPYAAYAPIEIDYWQPTDYLEGVAWSWNTFNDLQGRLPVARFWLVSDSDRLEELDNWVNRVEPIFSGKMESYCTVLRYLD